MAEAIEPDVAITRARAAISDWRLRRRDTWSTLALVDEILARARRELEDVEDAEQLAEYLE